MRNNAARWLTLFTAMLALSFLANPKIAAADDDDPPARAARLSFAGGAVSFEPAGTDEWVDAVVNRPMTTGDKLWTDRDGRAEVRIDSYGLRLGPQTGFSFLNLDDNTVQVRLTEGSLNVRVRRLEDNETLEIDTPNLAFNVLRPGSYRIDVNENGDTTVVSVRAGQGEVTGGGSAYPVHAGDSVTFSGTDQLSADVQDYQGNDDFDRWCGDRDRRWDRSTAPKYVSDDVVGYEDLDEYGGWRPVPEYGTVWFPRTTVAGWAPYRYGHWVWVSPWGWTWVDDAPWGFAPFHYGRWVTVDGVWGWVPSPPRPAVVTVAYVRPVYAPALVAWVGGSHFGVGVAVGGAPSGVAWFPLGPRDVYCPSYHVSPRYVERVNVSNTVIVNRTQVTNVYNNVYVNKTTNVTNITYQNQRANNAVTATSQASFTSAQPVGRNMVRVDEREVASAPVAPMTNVAPQQRSFAGATGPARARPPVNVVTRQVVAKATPPPPPAPVAKQVQAVQANGGRPPAVSQVRDARPEAARSNVKIVAAAKPAPLPARGQPNRPGQPPVQPQQNRPAPNQPNEPAAQPNTNQPAVRPNANQPPAQPNPNQPAAKPNPNQPAERPNSNRPEERPNPNRPPSANNPNQPNPNRANPSQPTPNQPAAPGQPAPNQPAARPNPNQPPERPNSNRPEERPNPNRPPSANNPNQPNPNRANPSQPTPNQPAPSQPAARPNPNQPAEKPKPNRPEERANPNRPPAANTPNEPNPNANRPANRPPNDRPSAAPPAVDRQVEQQQLEKQRQQEQQQQRMEQQRANEQRQQQIQKQQQQQQKPQQNERKEVQRQQQPPKQQQENARPQPPKKENKENKENKDRPPSR